MNVTDKHRNIIQGGMSRHPEGPHGTALISYMITLEAWRRGIEVKFSTAFVRNQIKIRYALTFEGREHKFQLSLGDKVSKEARRIGKSKVLTKQHLMSANVPVPEGKVLSINDSEYDAAINYAETLGYPVIIKPAHASLAIGVHTNIRDTDELISALNEVHRKLGYTDIIIERHATGEDTRAYVIEDQVVGAFKRVPANIVGNGIESIRALIDKKNRQREANPHLSRNMIKVDDDLVGFIESQGYQLDSVLEAGASINLNESTFAKDSSEIIDITDEITEAYKCTAINAVKSIPGMHVAGVDIIMDPETDDNLVLEVNCRPDIGGHLYPSAGQSRDIPSAIIDYYFPETIRSDKGNNAYFIFNYDSVINILKTGIVKEVSLPPLPKKNVTNKYMRLTGDIRKVKSRIVKTAIGYRLGGGMKEINENEAELIIAGRKRHIDGFMEKMLELRSDVNIEVTAENIWRTLIMYQFDTSSETTSNLLAPLKEENDSEVKELKKENKALLKKVAQMKNSRSWKITKPLRAISGMKKK